MHLGKIKKRYIFGALLFIIPVSLFLFGPLLPWSPIKPGYAEYRSNSYTVYYPANQNLPEYYKTLEPQLTEMSNTFDLQFNKKINIIRTQKFFLQMYLPWMGTSSVGGVALQTGDTMYISYQKIAEQGQNEEEFIKHELVHLLHHQNTSLQNAFRGLQVPYMSEGVAVFFGGPNYYSRGEFLSKVAGLSLKETPVGTTIYTETTFDPLKDQPADKYKVSTMLYGEFIRYLRNTYGEEKFNSFNHKFISQPENHRELFEAEYNKKLEQALQEFEETLLAKTVEQPTQTTMQGKITCALLKDTSNVTDQLCITALATDQGVYLFDTYLMSQIPPEYKVGDTIKATGVITKITERTEDFDVVGVFSATNSLEVLETK